MLKKRVGAVSSVCCETGDIRRTNQDAILTRFGKIEKHIVGMYVIADGCGGMSYGERISNLLIESFSNIWEDELPQLFRTYKKPKKHINRVFSVWLEQINRVAFSFRQRIGEGVGSTLSLLLTIDWDYFIFNIGDSRVYRHNKHGFRQLTKDQSLLADMIRNGEIKLENASQIKKNILTMCVGGFEKLQIFCTNGTIRNGDIFLLCSDGLYGAISDEELASVIPLEVAEESAKEIRKKIPYGEAKDNVSVILVQVYAEDVWHGRS